MPRRSGRTQRMLQVVLRSTMTNNVIVAHTQEYADQLQEQFLDMLDVDKLKGRTFRFIGASNPREVHNTVRGTHATVFYDHHFWESWYGRSVAT